MVPPLSLREIKRLCKAYEVIEPYHTPKSIECKMRLNGFKVDFGFSIVVKTETLGIIFDFRCRPYMQGRF